MEGEKGGDRASMDEAWSILEEVLEMLNARAEVRGSWHLMWSKSAYTFISVPTMHCVQSSRDICGLLPGTVSRDGGTVAAD